MDLYHGFLNKRPTVLIAFFPDSHSHELCNKHGAVYTSVRALKLFVVKEKNQKRPNFSALASKDIEPR